MMHSLYYADEVRDFSEVERGDAVTVKPGELQLAVQLIEQLASSELRPDQVRGRVPRAGRSRSSSRRSPARRSPSRPAHAPRAQIIDLMDALKASLAAKSAEPEKAVASAGGGRRPARAKGAAATGTERARKSKVSQPPAHAAARARRDRP